MSQGPTANRREFLHGRAASRALRAVTNGLVENGACPSQQNPLTVGPLSLVQVSRQAMACTFAVFLDASQYPKATQIGLEALDLLEPLEAQLSVYRTSSEVCQINRQAYACPIRVEQQLFHLLECAQEIALSTEGAFDVTSAPLTAAWGFHHRKGRRPTPVELSALLERIGWKYLQLDRQAQTIHFLKPGVEINVNALGKGYALERMATQLRSEGIENFLIHGGQSSLLCEGCQGQDQQGWKVGIRHPLVPTRRIAEIWLAHQGLGTSGSGKQFFQHAGKHYGHLIDPRSGYPTEGVFSATAIAPTATEADALATAFYVMGPERSRRYCEKFPQFGVLLVTAGQEPGTIDLQAHGLQDQNWCRLN